jgi:hypothetical protein
MERYLVLLAILALGGWRIRRLLRGLRYVNARIRARKLRESKTQTRSSQS